MQKKRVSKLDITALNCGGWKWRLTDEAWNSRLRRICIHLKEKRPDGFIYGLTEVQLSGGKYIDVIREFFPESDYHLVLPRAWKNQPKSVVSLVIINKKFCDSYSTMELPGLEDSLRYNFVTINTYVEGLCFRVLNVNVPHIAFDRSITADWYYEDRLKLKEKFIENIEKLAKTYANEPDLKFICLGDLNSTETDPFIKGLVYDFNRPMLDATKKEDMEKPTWVNYYLGSKNRLDYIFYSNGMLNNTGVSANYTEVDRSIITDRKSDHCALFGGITLDFAV